MATSPKRYGAPLYQALERSPPYTAKTRRVLDLDGGLSMGGGASGGLGLSGGVGIGGGGGGGGGYAGVPTQTARKSNYGGVPSLPGGGDPEITSILGSFPSIAKSDFNVDILPKRSYVDRVPITANTFQPAQCYFIGVWRRTPFDFYSVPMCLNSENGAHLTPFDVDRGVLWRFVPSETTSNGFYLEAADLPEPAYMASDLGLTPDMATAALFTYEFTDPFRGGPHDIAVRIFDERGRVLCSQESTGRVVLLSDREADAQDLDGSWMYNHSWEVAPDIDDPELDMFLQQYLEEE